MTMMADGRTIYRRYTVEPVNPSDTSYTTGNSAQVSFSWSSSDQREWIPTRSYLMMDVLLTKANGTAHATADAVTLLTDWPQRCAQRWTHTVAGSQVQQSDQSLASHTSLKQTEMNYVHRLTVAGRPFGDSPSTTPFNGALTTLGVALRPPMALWYSPVGVRGANHELTLSLPPSDDLPAQIYTTPADHKASITRLRLFVAMAERQEYEPIMPSLSVPLKNVSIYTSSILTQNSEHIEDFMIPMSTYHIKVWLSLATDTRLTPTPGSIKNVSIRFRGVQKPSLDLVDISSANSDRDQVRAFLDSMSENRSLNPEYAYPMTYEEWVSAPVYSFDTSFKANLTDRQLQLRGTSAAAAGATAVKFVIAAYHNSRLDMQTRDGRVVEASFVRDST